MLYVAFNINPVPWNRFENKSEDTSTNKHFFPHIKNGVKMPIHTSAPKLSNSSIL